jgi:hypothetical protein
VAFSGASGSPLDQFNSNFSGQSGSITPTQNNEVVVSGMSSIDSATATVDSGFTGIAVPNVTAQHIGNGIAYLIQTTATSENVTWSVGDGKVTIASFISGSGSAGFISLGPTIQYRRRR